MIDMLGQIVLYRTDGRNGLLYDLPAIVTCVEESHPGDYLDGSNNPLPVPSPGHVHLTVFTPGGFGTRIGGDHSREPENDAEFVGATKMRPGSGTYVEWDVPEASDPTDPAPRTWRSR